MNFSHLPGFLPSPNTSCCCTAKQQQKKPSKETKTKPKDNPPPPPRPRVSGEHCRLRCISPQVASPSPAWLCPQGMTYTASNRLPCLGFSNGRRRQRFSQWERPAEVQPMGEAGRGSANGRGQQRFSQWERSAEVQPMGRVGRGSANGRGRQRFSQWEGSAEGRGRS